MANSTDSNRINPAMTKRPAKSSPATPPKTIAIACQGGGSHTAFTGGVLQTLLRELDPAQHRIIGLSGTSGGALCAAVAWYWLLQDKPGMAAEQLTSFWQKMATTKIPDAIANQFMVWMQRSASYLALPELSPYQLPNSGQDYLAGIIGEHIDFTKLPALIAPDSPRLMVGAVEVLSGKFATFRSHHSQPEKRISLAALLASAAIPELFRAVKIGDGVYWDGLFSQNPPVRGFLSGVQEQDAKPDEIWVIQINPDSRSAEPTSLGDITDRRNELSGNLSLKQELFFVEQTNDWLRKGWLNAPQFKQVAVRTIPLGLELDYPSKLDRSPAFINALLAEGRRAATAFLRDL
jgi:NTE family protein